MYRLEDMEDRKQVFLRLVSGICILLSIEINKRESFSISFYSTFILIIIQDKNKYKFR